MSFSIPPDEDAVIVGVAAALQADGMSVAISDPSGLTVPYTVVDPIDFVADGRAGDWNADADVFVQVRSVAATPRGALQLKHRTRQVLLADGSPVTAAGLTIRVGMGDGTFGPEPDKSVEPPVYVAAGTFELYVTPT